MTDIDALVITRVSKSYPGVHALQDVSLRVPTGRVQGIVGENGAGKSTLMKSVAGAQPVDHGVIEVFGTRLAGANPRQAAEAGVAMIYQELTTVPQLSAEANVFLGDPPRRLGVIDRAQRRRRYREVAERVGSSIPPQGIAGELSTANQQIIELMRALVTGRRLIIMDEPTASLGPEDLERLHTTIRDLKASGCSVVYVSHDLDAVLDICDDVTVLREGQVVASAPASEWDRGGLIKAMIGDADLGISGASHRTPVDGARVMFSIQNLRAPGVDVERLALREGEIVGIAGLVGSGRTRLLRAIAGCDPVDSGRMQWEGRAVAWPSSPRAARRQGIALAPEDRKLQGLVLHQPASWNVALGSFGRVGSGPAVFLTRIHRWAERFTTSMGFARDRLTALAGQLSGGNQQKLLLARLVSTSARVLLLDEPTRGIDIGAKAQIFDSMRQLAEDGRTVVWSSSEIEEVLDHSDRILVVSRGRLVGELPAGATAHDVLDLSFSATSATQILPGSKETQS